MTTFIISMLLLTSAWAGGINVKCYEQSRTDSDLKLTTLLSVHKRKINYKRLDGDEVLERGKLKRRVEGRGEEAAVCLGKKGDFNWFAFCQNDEIMIHNTPHGRLVSLYGIREYDLGIELHCEMHILDFLN